ncbi:unnamed protein product, partial [Meganyctiphanes norvegica]
MGVFKNFYFFLILFCLSYISYFFSFLHIHPNERYKASSKSWKTEKQSYAKAANLLMGKANIKIQNIYWQDWLTSRNTQFYLYSAFYDNRSSVQNAPVIRIVTMKNKYNESARHYLCQILFDDNIIVTKPVSKLESLNNHHRETHKLQAFLLTCELGVDFKYLVPKSISIIENNQAQNSLDVKYSPIPEE